MRYSEKSYTPVISDKIQSILRTYVKSRMLPTCIVQRARIFLMASEGKLNKEIALEVDIHPVNIGKWRKRFLDTLESLRVIENDAPDKLEDELIKILKDQKRPGTPCTYTADQQAFIVTMACQSPKEHGFELSHWNLSALRLAVIAKGIVSDISVSTINRILNANEVRPHKNQYWLHSTDKADDPETYKKRVTAINEAYAMAQKIREKEILEDVCIYSTDEMTGVQALEHKYPDKSPLPNMVSKQEFEYIRHGTISLSAFFNVVTGTVAPAYINDTRTESDFVAALKQLVETDPEKKWIIIADNLNTHYSASLVEYVAKFCGITDDLGKKGKNGILHTKETRKAFLSNSEHRLYFLYTPKHCSWMNQIEIWFGIINRQLLKRKSFCSVDELITSIHRYIEQYNKLFAHPFNWKYHTTPIGD